VTSGRADNGGIVRLSAFLPASRAHRWPDKASAGGSFSIRWSWDTRKNARSAERRFHFLFSNQYI